MNENIDLTKILKDCPKGTKLYSTIFGEVEFVRVYQDDSVNFIVEIKLSSGAIDSVTADGRYCSIYAGECILFPSKDQRDWSKFTAPWHRFDPKSLKPFDKVLVRDFLNDYWRCSIFSHIETDKRRSLFPYTTVGGNFSFCIPYNDDTKYLVGTKDEPSNYYKYWED